MQLYSTIPVYSTNPIDNSIRVIEWNTYIDESNNKRYVQSREYTIHLYDKQGQPQTYTNKSNVDVQA